MSRKRTPPRRRNHRLRLATFGAILTAAFIALVVGLTTAWTTARETSAFSDPTSTPSPTATPVPPALGPAPPQASLRVLSVAFDGTPEPAPEPPPPPPGPTLAESPAGLRLWSHGDSTSYFVTIALYQIWRDQGGTPVAPADYKISSGLATPHFFDWPAFVSAEMARYNPDIAVIMVGGNDILQMGTRERYAERVGRMMDLLHGESRIVVWLGQPNFGPGRDALAATVPVLNDIQREEAAKRPWVIYVDTFALTSLSDGTFTWEQSDIFGNIVRIRHDDGVHFTSAGGRHLAVGVMGALFGPR